MSELPLIMKPQEGVHQNMCLQLQNNNDFLKSSSASSASSSSLSSSSPDSTYSLSSLDVELPEGMMGRKAAASEDDSGIQSPDCRPDDNDNSVSVYLDANEEGWHAECDDQDNVTIIQNRNHKSDNVFSDAGVDGEQGRRGSGDSSATEAQLFSSVDEEGEDEEEEDSFLSLRSADGVMRKQSEHEEVQMCSSNKRPSLGPVIELHQETFQDSMDHPNEEGHMFSSTVRPSVGPVSKVHQETFQDSMDHPNEEGHMFSSTVRPSVDLVSELHQEVSQVVYNDKSKMQRSTKGTDVDLGSEFDHKAPQESVELHKNQEQMHCSNRNLDVGSVCQEILQESMELHNEENQIQTSAKRPSVEPNVDLVSKVHQEAVQTTIDLPTEKSPSPPPAELILNQTMSPSVSQGAPPSTPSQDIKDPPCFHKRNISQNNNDPPNLSHTWSPIEPLKIKYTKVELKRFSRPNLKDIKPKVISRATSAPRPANTDHIQSAAGCEKNSLTTRSRAVNRREQGDDGVKQNRASSTQARATTPITISDSDSKSTWPPMVKKQPPEFPGSKVVPNGCHVQTASSKVTETMRDERGSHKDEVVVKETSRDGDVDQTVSSDLRPPGVVTRVPTRGCVSAGVRAAPLAGVPKMRVIDSNPAVCGSAPSWKAPLKSASSKLPVKTGSLPMSLSSSSVGSSASENKGAAQVMKSEETCARPSSSSQGKSASTKPAAGVRNRANTLTKPSTAGQKATAHVIQSKTTQNALQRGGPVRPSRNSATVCPSSRGPRGTRPAHTHTEEEEEKKNRSILHLRSLVAHGNRKLEALAIVVQHIFNEREETLKQKKEISIQLKNLREELAQSVVCCERLECEKASVCAQLDAAVLTLQQQHQAELAQLEERLRDFYSAEWDKAHQAYQDEADRCTALMRQQVEEVKSKQEALRTEQEVAHSRQIEELRQGYETMLAELQKGHERDRQELDNTLKRSEAALNERIASLMEENEALSERLRESEERRKALADKSQRDSRVVYLEQELESLKVVLDIKTNQLHQHDKKLMQMDKLIESNVKLEEFVTKLQQENEDYKARMDKHAELSRQLSTEQAMLQQTLQKESKANKRLSMENEELLWKLHNGLSPRNSASFPSSPISPR
ncbi:microtubule-associated tumor suppressor 1 [Pangasianodon hypophthalmus]|uniref:microtubule-associated tumor suppressor 1 n=1 Tax=Pangasianodon hypophthalmus TaxID=310915 RepID=UPI0023073BE8|nr:microtubule-associated tumor suppressor 1 [Pangasianodon hypophthalmus]